MRRCVVIVAACLLATRVGAQVTVTRNVNLRRTPSSAEAPIKLLQPPAVLALLDTVATDGYWHVVAAPHDTGWVWSRNVSVAFPPADGPDGPPLPPPGTFAGTNASCPATGTHVIGGAPTAYDDTTDAGLRNMAKRHIPTGTAPVSLDLFAMHALQDDVNSRFADAHGTITRFHPDRHSLKDLPTPNGTVSEGDLVQLVAYVIAVKPEGPESVNCAGADGRDIHISVGPKQGTQWQGIVVEMIPQLGRPSGWDSAHVARIGAAGLPVLVIGGLTYDNEHLVNDDAAHNKSGQPKRMSLWEVHPVTAVLVCEHVTCDPKHHAEWTTLTAWAAAHSP